MEWTGNITLEVDGQVTVLPGEVLGPSEDLKVLAKGAFTDTYCPGFIKIGEGETSVTGERSFNLIFKSWDKGVAVIVNIGEEQLVELLGEISNSLGIHNSVS